MSAKKKMTEAEAKALNDAHVVREEYADGLGPATLGRDEAVDRAIKAEARLSSMMLLTNSMKKERNATLKVNSALLAEKGELLRQVAELTAQRDEAVAKAERLDGAATQNQWLRDRVNSLLAENIGLNVQLERVKPEFREIKALLHGLYEKIEAKVEGRAEA